MTTFSPKPTPTVYSWYTPEIEGVVQDLALNYPVEPFKQNFSPGLDEYHLPLMDDYLHHSASAIFTDKGVDALHGSYYGHYTNGSSEGLFHLLARHKTYYPNVPLYQFEGEYQGYGEFARTLGLQFQSIPYGLDTAILRPGVFFISVPSAVDGNRVLPAVIEKICASDHHVVIDIAYAGMTEAKELEGIQKLSSNSRIAAVVGSMSKPFGLYYHRIGFLWSHDPVISLVGNKWFKNIFSIEIGKAVFKQYGAQDLTKQYRPWQERACKEASEHLGYSIVPSDVWLLGYALPNAQDALPHSLGPFKRGPGYRFCLTPYYMSYVNE